MLNELSSVISYCIIIICTFFIRKRILVFLHKKVNPTKSDESLCSTVVVKPFFSGGRRKEEDPTEQGSDDE